MLHDDVLMKHQKSEVEQCTPFMFTSGRYVCYGALSLLIRCDQFFRSSSLTNQSLLGHSQTQDSKEDLQYLCVESYR